MALRDLRKFDICVRGQVFGRKEYISTRIIPSLEKRETKTKKEATITIICTSYIMISVFVFILLNNRTTTTLKASSNEPDSR
jgi:hypothetical protein